ncbi:MAG: AAA family ATPase [Chloroflexi bacterium]|nr:AAA family ATPase [Chloroflexota bacterium]
MASIELDERRAIFVVSGTQGAGKTTVSSLLARRFKRGVRVSADDLQKMIVSGTEWPVAAQTTLNSPDFDDEVVRQLRLRLHNMCLLGRSFFDAGFAVVLDDIIVGDRLADLRAELSGVEFLFVMLNPSKEAVRERERQRGTELWREWEWLTESVEQATPRVGLWLNSSDQTAEETVDEIMSKAWAEAKLS